MDDIRCAREGCENPLNTGSRFCSTSCANKHNAATRTKAVTLTGNKEVTDMVRVIRGGNIPARVEDALIDGVGYTAASAVLQEIDLQLAISRSDLDEEFGIELSIPEYIRKRFPVGSTAGLYNISVPRQSLKAPTAADIEPDSTLLRNYGTTGMISDLRRDSAITFTDVDRLLKLGPYVFASRIKKGPIMSALSGKRKWKVDCDDAKLKAVIETDLERVFMREVANMLTCIDYGVSFGSVIWERKSAEQIGVGKGVGRNSQWYVVKKIQWAHPSTVDQILRDKKTFAFGGYTHVRQTVDPRVVAIPPGQALVLTYGERFGNMWGEPMGEGIYDFAFWYEIVMRAYLRYLQRMGTPVTVVYGPQHGTSVMPDGTRVSNPRYGLLLAGAAANSAGLWLPSDRDLQTGERLWEIDYLGTDQRGDQFIQVLRFLSTNLMRGAIIGDRAATQEEGGGGGYNIGQMHDKVTQIDNDYIFKSLLGQLNPYLVMRYGQYNRDYNNPPRAQLLSEVIDPLEQEVLMKLFATAGNVKFGDGTPLDRVDWEEAFHSIHVPVLTDEEFEAKYEESLERKGEAQQQSMDLQAEAMAKAAKANGGPPQNGNQPRQQQPQNKAQQARLSVLEHLSSGGAIPVIVTEEAMRDYFLSESIDIYDSVQLGVLDWLKDKAADTAEFIARAAGGGGKAGEAASAIARKLRKDGTPVEDPEFEKKHPRGESGKFAKKAEKTAKAAVKSIREALAMTGTAEYGAFVADKALSDGRITQKQRDGLVDMAGDLTGDDWPNSDSSKALSGRWEIGGITYDALGSVSPHNMVAATLSAMTTMNRLKDDGYDIAASKIAIVPRGGSGALSSYVANEIGNVGPLSVIDGGDESDLMDKQGGFYAAAWSEARLVGDKPVVVIMDDGLIDGMRHDIFESVMSHELLHSRQREGGTMQWKTKEDARYEEASTTILQQQYAEQHNAPYYLDGYTGSVSTLAEYAQDLGWPRSKLYDFVSSVHAINGDQYGSLFAQLSKAAAGSSSTEKWLNEWIEGSAETSRDMNEIYGG